jgi:hypothetical protein
VTVNKRNNASTANEASGGISVVPPDGSDVGGISVVPGAAVEEAAGGISVVPPIGAGGISVVPPVAATAKTHTSPRVASNFLIAISPLREGGSNGAATAAPNAAHRTPETPDPYSRFWTLHSAGRHFEALAYAEEGLELTPAEDEHGHLRWAYARTVAQRSLFDFDGALVTHNLIRPLVARASDKDLAGKCTHGRAVTLRELGRYSEAFDEFNATRRLFVKTGNLYNLASTDNNQALLLVAAFSTCARRPTTRGRGPSLPKGGYVRRVSTRTDLWRRSKGRARCGR